MEHLDRRLGWAIVLYDVSRKIILYYFVWCPYVCITCHFKDPKPSRLNLEVIVYASSSLIWRFNNGCVTQVTESDFILVRFGVGHL